MTRYLLYDIPRRTIEKGTKRGERKNKQKRGRLENNTACELDVEKLKFLNNKKCMVHTTFIGLFSQAMHLSSWLTHTASCENDVAVLMACLHLMRDTVSSCGT